MFQEDQQRNRENAASRARQPQDDVHQGARQKTRSHIAPPATRRDRVQLPLQVDSLLRRAAKGSAVRVLRDAMDLLSRHAWPGNICELRNVLERALLFADDGEIKPAHLGLDSAAKTGALEVKINPASVDFGNAALDQHVRSADFLNVEKYPAISYKSRALHFNGDLPASVDGDLTMMGVTKPVHLTIDHFNCVMHPRLKREVCGAEVAGEFQRSDFGMNFGLPNFSPLIKLSIQVEGIRAD